MSRENTDLGVWLLLLGTDSRTGTKMVLDVNLSEDSCSHCSVTYEETDVDIYR